MLARRGFLPFEEPLHLLKREEIRLPLGVIHAAPVDPAAQVRAHGHVGRGGDDVARERILAGQARHDGAERLLRGTHGGKIRTHLLGHGAGSYLLSGEGGSGVVARHGSLDRSGLGAFPREGRKLFSLSQTGGIAEFRDLRLGQELGVVHRVARDGKPPTLDGVGQDHHGLIMNAVRLTESLENALDVVAAQVG